MERARFAAASALLLVLVIASVAAGAAGPPGPVPLAAVTWPTATLVVSEVMTGGASASDEFVEIANQGSGPVDLAGLELAYVTSSGSTVTRKATWTETTILDPGRRYLVANVLGAYAAIADATYSGGFAATGGAIVLRAVGGGPVDAVGWGDATNGFVEGAVAPAPPAGSSIERRPGGIDGNGLDSNDNASDWFLQAVPSPQNVAAPPVPAVVPTPPPPTPTPTAEPTAEPSQTPEPTATPSADATPSGDPTPTTEPTPTAEPSSTHEPTATPTATPSPEPTATPSAAPSPTPEPTATPTPTPAPSPSPAPTPPPTPSPEPTPPPPSPLPSAAVTPIGDARLLADGSAVTVEGVLTTPLGALEAGRSAFVQDESGGIVIYLDAAAPDPWSAGTLVTATGTLDERYGARTLRVALAAIVARGPAQLPDALLVETGLAAEPYEGVRVEVIGTTVGSPSALTDGTGLSVDDGSGQVRVIVAPGALGSASVPAGTPVRAVGPLGQRDSSGTGTSGYRIHATNAGDFEVLEPAVTPTPTPSPTPTPTPTPAPSTSQAPSPAPSATPGPSPAPSVAPSPTPSQGPSGVASIASVRALPVGATATILGAVIAESGRLGTPALLVVADDTGGIVVRLPDGAAAPSRGSWLRITGKLADPYGQIELRPSSNGLAPTTGPAGGAVPVAIDGGPIGETTEGRLVSIVGRLARPPAKTTSNDIQLDLETAGGSIRVLADASSRIGTDLFVTGGTYRLTGIVGQRATRKGALDGYRLWLRDPNDVDHLPEGDAVAPSAPTISIADAISLDLDSSAVVQGVVTADARLLDASGRRIVIDDGTAAVEVLLPATGPRPSVGTVLRAAGEMARAYGAPRLRAARVEALGPGSVPAPIVLRRAPSDANEWRLVRVAGTVVDVRRLGDRWTAEVAVGSTRVPIVGLPGAGIASTALAEGRPATISGIVRRPYPSASDRRFAIVPRGPSDLSAAPADGHGEASVARSAGGGSASSTGAALRSAVAPYVDVDLGQLDEHVGERVRVGGLIVAIDDAVVIIDDGTARGHVVLTGEAGAFLALLHVDDAINAIGVVARQEAGVAVVVDEPAGLLRVGALGELLPVALATAQPQGDHDASAAGDGARRAGLADGFALSLDGTTGAASLALALLASVAVTLLRRYRDRRALAARVARRLASLGLAPRPPAPDGG